MGKTCSKLLDYRLIENLKNRAKKQRISSAQASSTKVKSEENDDEWEKYEKNSREDDWKDGDNE